MEEADLTEVAATRAAPHPRPRRGSLTLCSSASVLLFSSCCLVGGSHDFEFAREQCPCPEPLDDAPEEGDEGDEHEWFDLGFANVAVNGKKPSPDGLQEVELEPLEFTWDVTYDWESCKSSTAGHSGDFDVVYELQDAAGTVLWDGRIPTNVKMGQPVAQSALLPGGVEVAGDDADDELDLSFLLAIEASAEQECNEDGDTAALTANNFDGLQLEILNCPCDGLFSKTLFPVDPDWEEVPRQFLWTNTYTAVECGIASGTVVAAAGSYNEVITVEDSLTGSVTFSDTLPGPELTAGTPLDRSVDIPADAMPGVGPYILKILLDPVDTDLECNESQANSNSTITT